MESIIFFSVFN